jgi:hypothetical protein
MRFDFAELDRPGKKVTKQIDNHVTFYADHIEFANKYEAVFTGDDDVEEGDVALLVEGELDLVDYNFVCLRSCLVGVDWGYHRDKKFYEVELYLTAMGNVKVQYKKKRPLRNYLITARNIC